MGDVFDHVKVLNANQKKMVRELSVDDGSVLGCSEGVANGLCKETTKRPALVWRRKEEGDWNYRLTLPGAKVQQVLLAFAELREIYR